MQRYRVFGNGRENHAVCRLKYWKIGSGFIDLGERAGGVAPASVWCVQPRDNFGELLHWYRAAETAMKSEGHFWATLNYVLHNAVRHGYVERWQDWPCSNAAQYLEETGRQEVERRWRAYPVLDYGKDWDPPEL